MTDKPTTGRVIVVGNRTGMATAFKKLAEDGLIAVDIETDMPATIVRDVDYTNLELRAAAVAADIDPGTPLPAFEDLPADARKAFSDRFSEQALRASKAYRSITLGVALRAYQAALMENLARLAAKQREAATLDRLQTKVVYPELAIGRELLDLKERKKAQWKSEVYGNSRKLRKGHL